MEDGSGIAIPVLGALLLRAGIAFAQFKDAVRPLVVGSTVVFGPGGPALTRLALIRAGDADPTGERGS